MTASATLAMTRSRKALLLFPAALMEFPRCCALIHQQLPGVQTDGGGSARGEPDVSAARLPGGGWDWVHPEPDPDEASANIPIEEEPAAPLPAGGWDWVHPAPDPDELSANIPIEEESTGADAVAAAGSDFAASPDRYPYFMHIPKNAGMAVEASGQSAGFAWGFHVYRGANKLDMPDGNVCSWFHVPPDDLPALNRSLFYTSRKTFCTTRHPYLRAVSEYKWGLDLLPGVAKETLALLEAGPRCTPEGLNKFVRGSLEAYQNGMRYIHDCHMIPQSAYIFGKEGNYCDHALRVDDLPGNYNSLMKHYGLSARLTTEHRNSHAHLCPGLDWQDLEQDTKDMLDSVYADDFTRLGYAKGCSDNNCVHQRDVNYSDSLG